MIGRSPPLTSTCRFTSASTIAQLRKRHTALGSCPRTGALWHQQLAPDDDRCVGKQCSPAASACVHVFGGEVELRNLAWPDIIRDPKAVTFSADTKRLQLQELTEAFNWPRFSGQLNGAIPEVESAGNSYAPAARSRQNYLADGCFSANWRLRIHFPLWHRSR
jgi:hypothetical protein